jgi:hypothetical protein
MSLAAALYWRAVLICPRIESSTEPALQILLRAASMSQCNVIYITATW